MAHSKEVRSAVRSNYINGLPLTTASTEAGVSYETARTWKRKAAIAGDNWDNLRASRQLTRGGVKELTHQVLEDFADTFTQTIKMLKEAENIPALQRAQALAQLSDAYQKTIKAVGDSNPKMANLAMVMDVIQRLGAFIQEHHSEHLKIFTEILDGFGQVITSEYR